MNGRFVATRLLEVVPVVLAIVLTGFLLIHAAPGDPILALAGENGDAGYYADMRRRFGLDASLPSQLLTYFTRVLQGDFGFSYVQGRSALAVVLERVPATILLTGTALLLAILIGMPLGAIAARREHGAGDIGISAVALAMHSTPAFLTAQLGMLAFALGLGIAPVQGMASAGSTAAGASHALDVARHLALPAFVLALQEIAVLVRLTRSGLIEELGRDHIRTARAKGVGELQLLLRHAFPRAMLPSITVIGARAAHLLAGAVTVEIVFGWPGMGRLLLSALQTRDAPVLLAIFFVVAFTVVLANLATDLVHAALDPRITLR